MKALVLKEYKKLVYEDIPDPVYGDNEVLIRVKACGICGSDIHGFDGSTGRRIPPIVMGHEASGIIEAVGSAVKGWKVGERVTFDSTVYRLDDWYTLRGMYNLSDNREVIGVSPGTYRRNGAFAEFLAVPAHILYRIPGNVTFEQAAMVEAGAVALHALNIGSPSPGDVCLVTGAGTIGLFLIKLLRIAGAGTVIVCDISAGSHEMALKAGADHAFTPDDPMLEPTVRSLTSGRGADLAFEAVGKTESINLCINLVRRAASVVLVGNTSPKVEIPLQKVVTGEIRLLGSCAIRGEYDQILGLLSSGRLSVNDQILTTAPLSDGGAWFSKLYNRETGPGKVILIP